MGAWESTDDRRARKRAERQARFQALMQGLMALANTGLQLKELSNRKEHYDNIAKIQQGQLDLQQKGLALDERRFASEEKNKRQERWDAQQRQYLDAWKNMQDARAQTQLGKLEGQARAAEDEQKHRREIEILGLKENPQKQYVEQVSGIALTAANGDFDLAVDMLTRASDSDLNLRGSEAAGPIPPAILGKVDPRTRASAITALRTQQLQERQKQIELQRKTGQQKQQTGQVELPTQGASVPPGSDPGFFRRAAGGVDYLVGSAKGPQPHGMGYGAFTAWGRPPGSAAATSTLNRANEFDEVNMGSTAPGYPIEALRGGGTDRAVREALGGQTGDAIGELERLLNPNIYRGGGGKMMSLEELSKRLGVPVR